MKLKGTIGECITLYFKNGRLPESVTEILVPIFSDTEKCVQVNTESGEYLWVCKEEKWFIRPENGEWTETDEVDYLQIGVRCI